MGRSAANGRGGRTGGSPSDRFTVLRRLGTGGQGDVWLARRQIDGRLVALKTPRDATPRARARLVREAQLLGSLHDHPGVVNLVEDGSRAPRPFIALEYIAGGTLSERIGHGHRVPARTLRKWILQASGTVDVLARHGIVHRDLGPENWLVTARRDNLKLADLGIATGDEMRGLTKTAHVVGRAGFLAPEQLRGARADARTDQWQLARTLLALVTGLRPSQLGATPATGRGAAVDAVFARALHPDPQRRWPSCSAFGRALVRTLERRATRRGAGDRTRAHRPHAPAPARNAHGSVAHGRQRPRARRRRRRRNRGRALGRAMTRKRALPLGRRSNIFSR